MRPCAACSRPSSGSACSRTRTSTRAPPPPCWTRPRTASSRRTAAERSIVLLKNADRALPLDPDALGSVAVIGQLADSKRDLLGPWVFDHDTAETVTDPRRAAVASAAAATVTYAPGAGITERLFPSQFDRADPTVTCDPRRLG